MKKLLILLLLSTIVYAYQVYLPTEISYKKYNKILHMGANYTKMYHECLQRTKDEKYCYKTVKSLYELDNKVYKRGVEDAREIDK